MKKLKNNKGITLVALVVTIIVLLILAGVSLSAVFSDKGIFSRAEKAGNKYNEAKAREVLETILLGDGQYEKHSNPEYNQDDFLNDLITNEIPEAEIKGDIVIIGDYGFELDRSVPKIGKTLNPKDLIWPVVTVAEVTQADPTDNYRTATINITATIDEKAENGINRIEIWQNGVKLSPTIECNNEYSVTTTYQANKNGKYTIKAYSKVTDIEMTNGEIAGSAKTTVEGIVPAVQFTPNGSTEWRKSHSTVVKADETTGTVTEMKYLWKKSGEAQPQVGDFSEACSNNGTITGQGEDMTGEYILWVAVTVGTGTNQKTYISGSEEFWFDNEGPKLEVTPTTDSTESFSILVNAEDISGITGFTCTTDGYNESEPTTENTYTFLVKTGAMGKYNVQVTAVDGLGNRTIENIEACTQRHTWDVYAVTSVCYYALSNPVSPSGLYKYTGLSAYTASSYRDGIILGSSCAQAAGRWVRNGSELVYLRQYVDNGGVDCYYVTKYSATYKCVPDRGASKGMTVQSNVDTEYPSNGEQGGSWYVYTGIH